MLIVDMIFFTNTLINFLIYFFSVKHNFPYIADVRKYVRFSSRFSTMYSKKSRQNDFFQYLLFFVSKGFFGSVYTVEDCMLKSEKEAIFCGTLKPS